MSLSKHPLGFADDTDTDADGFRPVDLVALAAASVTAAGEQASVMAVTAVAPAEPTGIAEPQLAGYCYGPAFMYGSNVMKAWQYSSGAGVTVGLVDDGLDPAVTATHLCGRYE